VRIEFVTHASILLHQGDVGLLADPWIEGAAFDNGWSLLSPPPQGYAIFQRATHLWFSHEHPDHFSPPVLKKIPPEVRSKLTVLMIETTDKKIVQFCSSLGFKEVRELKPLQVYELSKEVSFMVGAVGDDSWSLFISPRYKILNINDCSVGDAQVLAGIREHIGRPDVLLTQFSYAQWSGNSDDVSFRRSEAKRKLDEVDLQLRHFQPSWVIPFASFVWFSHCENSYMNDSVNDIGAVAEHIGSAASPIVMYPGDQWEVGENWDSASAVKRYLADRGTLPAREVRIDPSVALEQLRRQAQDRLTRMRRRLGFLTLFGARVVGLLPPTAIWLTDRYRAVTLTVWGLRPSRKAQTACDVSLSTAAFSYFLKFDWGGNTLEVNGRFSKPADGDYRRFHAWVSEGDSANHGRNLRLTQVLKLMAAPAYRGPIRPIWRAFKSRLSGRTRPATTQ
jgi:hypothetical protein